VTEKRQRNARKGETARIQERKRHEHYAFRAFFVISRNFLSICIYRKFTSMNAWDILVERGFIYQSTDAEQMRQLLDKGPVTFYVGFDPTGNSLHIGHLLPVMAMRWLQSCGHRPLALVGGGTAMIGDPSGKMEARPIMTVETIDENVRCLQGQLGEASQNQGQCCFGPPLVLSEMFFPHERF
jgi:hypothetical protein